MLGGTSQTTYAVGADLLFLASLSKKLDVKKFDFFSSSHQGKNRVNYK
jgi:hypothetical protein